ncbi:hypothetical protein Q1695_006082 [Nippostrongylus brasiliensis]|nr:hypothetical protein Q1695_006082 [Nippostrongylus brasiliensis]
MDEEEPRLMAPEPLEEQQSLPGEAASSESTDYLQYMGVPLKSGGHVLFPEEVVFLIELGKILATDNNNILGLDDGFRLLHECGIPFHKYRAYCALRRAGFVVMRPERSQVRSFLQSNTAFKIVANDEDALPPPTGARCSKQFFPKELLDAFPTVRRDMLICSQLQRNNRLVPVEDLSDFSFDPYAFRIPRKSSRDFRRQLRPEYWPAFDSFRCSILNWAEFAHRRSEAIVSARRAADIRRFHRLRKNQSVYDFEAFLSEWFMHTVSKDPAFRVICFDSRKGALSCPFMHTHSGQIPLMFSIFDYGYICFVELSGEPIDLNRYLEELSKKS